MLTISPQNECCSLFLNTESTPLYRAFFGRGYGTIAVYSARCQGNEQRLFDCPLSTSTYCGSRADAAVRCYVQTGIYSVL